MEIKIFDSPIETAQAFAAFMLEKHEERGKLNIALSGGSTPKILFDILAKDYQDRFDWAKINLYWGDERCVPPTDDESNYKMTLDHLLSKVNIPEKNIHRIKGEEDPS
ncbi:MAG TPA: 6-phosphogluconolactonase, partial [Roseivirga sp.]